MQRFRSQSFRSHSLLCFSLGLSAAVLALSGCNNSSNNTTTSNKAASPVTSSTSAPSNAKVLTIISPHTAEIIYEFSELWKAKNPDIELKWNDQSGASNALKFVREQFVSNGKEKGIGIDLFFGGGGETFTELEKDGLLTPLPSDYGVPAKLNGVPLHGKNKVWVAAALSGFGILYNKKIAARDKLPIPKTWADLAHPKLNDRISLADPRHSGSAHAIYEVILQTNGWDKGWKILTAMAGNARSFATSSSEPLKDVQNGEAVFTTAIDFYAFKTIAQSGADKLGYIEPKGQYVVTADPIGVLPGAPNPEAAKKFVDLVMSKEGQKLWFLPKGTVGGAKNDSLYRLPALPAVYAESMKQSTTKINPFQQKIASPYNSEKAAARRRALDDLIGSVLIDNADSVKTYWLKNPNIDQAGYVPLPEKEFETLATKWDDARLTSETKEKWSVAARARFEQ